jgi:hypothetical protein
LGKKYIKAIPDSEQKLNVLLSHLDAINEVLDLHHYRSLMMIYLEVEVTLETLTTNFKIFRKKMKDRLEFDEIKHSFSILE